MMRIASLLPSGTEIVFGLGLGDRLIGRSHDCDYPPQVEALPVLTRSRVDSARSSPEIDAQVGDLLKAQEPLYLVNHDLLEQLKPDLILSQQLCEVCGVTTRVVERLNLSWGPRVLSLDPSSLTDLFLDILAVGRATCHEREARAYIETLRRRLAIVRDRVADAPRPRVVCVEWLDPPMASGHWVPEMVTLAGGEELLGRLGEPSRKVAWELICEAEPEVLILMPCGFDVARTRAELPHLTRMPGWAELSAVQAGRVYLVNSSAYFSRPGPRLVDGVELLAHLLHPDRFSDSPSLDQAVQDLRSG